MFIKVFVILEFVEPLLWVAMKAMAHNGFREN